MTKTLVGSVGNVVSGDRFWGREAELQRLLEYIDEGAHLSIIAQRRIGKTSLMREAASRLSEDFIPLYIDLQASESSAGLVTELTIATAPHDGLWGKAKSVFSNLFSTATGCVDTISVADFEIKIKDGFSGDNWQDKGSQILNILASQEKRVVLFIDELPILISRMLNDYDSEGIKSVHTLLTWLRLQALKHKDKISMVFAGSIGLEPVLSRAKLSADINHLTPFELKPWTDPVALGCLEALAAHRKIELPKSAAQQMLDLLGCNIPYHVQLFFSKISEHCQEARALSCSPESIHEIFNARMLNSKGHSDLAHMEERLDKVFHKDELKLAMDILTQVAVIGFIEQAQVQTLCDRLQVTKVQRSKLLPELFTTLKHDGYLKKNTAGKYVFISNLSREWWRGKFGDFFETV